MFPKYRLDELPKWIQKEHGKLKSLVKELENNPRQLTMKEMKSANALFRLVKKIPKKYYEKKFEVPVDYLSPGPLMPPMSSRASMPLPPVPIVQWIPKKGRERNKLCNCGSGLKKKRCCWSLKPNKKIIGYR